MKILFFCRIMSFFIFDLTPNIIIIVYTTGQNCGTTYKNCIKNMLVFESGYLREKSSWKYFLKGVSKIIKFHVEKTLFKVFSLNRSRDSV